MARLQEIHASFEILSWDETSIDEAASGKKLMRASVRRKFTGGLLGESDLEYLMMYAENGSASFVGMEKFQGALLGRGGSFVLQHSGVFENGRAKESCFIIPGTGTEDLFGITGDGELVSGRNEQNTLTMHVEFSTDVSRDR